VAQGKSELDQRP